MNKLTIKGKRQYCPRGNVLTRRWHWVVPQSFHLEETLKYGFDSVTFVSGVSEGITKKHHPLRKQQQKIQQRRMHTGEGEESLSREVLLVFAWAEFRAWGQSCLQPWTRCGSVHPGWGCSKGKPQSPSILLLAFKCWVYFPCENAIWRQENLRYSLKALSSTGKITLGQNQELELYVLC